MAHAVESPGGARDPGSIFWSGKSPGEGNDNPLQFSCLENPMDGGTWQSTVHWVAKSRTRLNGFTFNSSFLKNIFSLFIYLDVPGLLCGMQVEACGWDPDLGFNQGPLHWELRVLVTGPPGEPLSQVLPFCGNFVLNSVFLQVSYISIYCFPKRLVFHIQKCEVYRKKLQRTS